MSKPRQSEVLCLSAAMWLAMLPLGAGCKQDGETCEAPVNEGDALAINAADSALAAGAWGPLLASVNNDCPRPDAPQGVISVTVSGEVTAAGSQGVATLCIPRPDLMGADEPTLHTLVKGAPTADALAQTAIGLLDLTLIREGCTATLAQVTGTARSVGYCTSDADFQLTFDANLTFDIGCPDAPARQATATLSSTAFVAF